MSSPIDTASGPLSAAKGDEKPLLRSLPPESDDLLILARDDKFYWLKKDAYQNPEHVIPSSMTGQAKHLVEQGVVLADIPLGSVPGVGCMCYLVNLSGLRRPQAPTPTLKPQQGRATFAPKPVDPASPCLRDPVTAFDDLVIFDRSGVASYWVKQCEYQRLECRLELAEPILEEQLRLLTNQGVVLADIPGGRLPGVDDMGCLVNLSAIHRLETKEEMAKSAPTAKSEGQP